MKRIYYNGYVLTGHEDMEPLAGLAVVTEDDKIVSICKSEDVKPGKNDIDLNGGYIMPGLINLHVHIPASGGPEGTKDPKKTVRMITRNAVLEKVGMELEKSFVKMELMSGVTTLRAVGGIKDFDTRMRDMINAGKAVGPRILAADMAVSVPEGHMAGSLAYEAHTPQEAALYVRNIALNKPDFIKLMITGGVLDAEVKGEPGVVKMPPEMVKAACDQAHELGLYVAAHVESPEGVKIALQNGVTSIEHGAEPDEETVELFKKVNGFHVLTLSPTLYFVEFDPALTGMDEVAIYNGEVVMKGMIDCAKACLENGIPVGLGTDTGCPYVMHNGMWREIMYYVKYCGVTNKFALYTATKLNAELAGVGDITGTIEEGKCADMIVTRGNPLEDLETLREPVMVVARGQLYNHPKTKHDEDVDREMDKYIR